MTVVISSRAEETYNFRRITTANGLSNSMVKCMLIDRQGFLWIGTDMGLNRYDGYEVEPMMPRDSSIDELQEDNEGYIWIDCQHAYLIYNTHIRQFITDVPSLLSRRGISVGRQAYKVKIASDGTLWVLQPGRLSRRDSRSHEVKTWKNPQFRVEDLNLYACSATRDTLLLAGKQAVSLFTATTGQLTQLVLPAAMQRKDNIYGTFIDRDHSLWVFSIIDENICRQNAEKGWEMVYLPSAGLSDSKNNAIRDMMDDGRGNVWIATDHKGIVVYHKKTGQTTLLMSRPGESGQLSSNNVISLLRDRQGTVWAGHYKTGISYTSATPRMFRRLGQQYGDISTLYGDSQRNLWIGTDGDGLYVEHPDGTSRKTALPNITVSAITEDPEGTIWVGTYSEGLFRMAGEDRYEQYALSNGRLPTNSVWRVISDHHDGIWCGSAISPLVRVDKNTRRWEEQKDREGNDILATDFCIDNRGRLLITSTYGLFIYDGRQATRFTTNLSGQQEMESKMATSACYDARRDILLMGHKQGLTLFDMKNDSLYFTSTSTRASTLDAQHSTLNTQHSTLSVKSIVQDRKGLFWLSTSSGISRLDVGRQPDGTLSWDLRNYTAHEGLQTPIFNANSSALTLDGHVLFGGIEGYTEVRGVDADVDVDVNKYKPVIISVTAGDQLMDTAEGRVTLSHDAGHVVIRYFAGILNPASRLRYAYKIEGMMSDWAYTEENHITLVGLSPGDYCLLLKVGEGADDGNPVCQLSLHVNPPFYLSSWAFLVYTLLAVLAACLLWLYVRHRKQLKRRQEQFVEWAGKSHQDFQKKLDVRPSEVTITPLDEQFLQKAIKLVEDQMSSSDLTVETLGQQLGMSRSFLYKKLMAITGLGPAEFIRTIRIKRGLALLERSQMQITEIAYAVGFNSLKSFTMNFKAEYGITPSDYLKTLKKQGGET